MSEVFNVVRRKEFGPYDACLFYFVALRMKSIFILLTLLSFGIVAKAQKNPVIIELFTSQGCSSCPAADKNLTELLKKATTESEQVYGLSFHVDYWNYIGWKDPYSSKQFTARQQAYRDHLEAESTYTPQMIVNGTTEFVGSNKKASEQAIAAALRSRPKYNISILKLKSQAGSIKIQYAIDGQPMGEVINMALVERSVENYVPRGENTGKKLHHDNVVRAFRTSILTSKDELEIAISEIDFSKTSIVLYIQDSQMRVLGATSVEVGK